MSNGSLPASDGLAFSFPPPAIPGIGTSGGVTMILQDRSGNDDPTFLTKNLFAFLGPSQAPGDRRRHSVLSSGRAAALCRRGPRKGLAQQVDLNNIYTTMQTFMGGYLVNYFNRFGRQWQTYVEAEGDTRTNIQNINQFYVRSANGSRVPLGSLVHVRQITGPEFILRFNEYNAAQINISGAPGYSSGQVRAALEEVFHQTMPASMGFSYQGMSYQEQRAAEGVPAWVVFGISLLFVFLILAALYESWTLPFSVLLSTPVAILGAYLALSLRSLENDIFATVGLIMLIGLSAKNAILIVEFAVSNYRAGQSISQSALDAARAALPPHRDDRPRVHLRLSAAVDRQRLRRGFAAHSRNRGNRRHDAGHADRNSDDPGDFRCGGVPFPPLCPRRQRTSPWIPPTGLEDPDPWRPGAGRRTGMKMRLPQSRDACRRGLF